MPVKVEIAVYDLLPPSRVSTSFYYLGVGIYHSAIRIPELNAEFAYGGMLPTSGMTQEALATPGIFSVPSPDDHTVPERSMPGVRFLKRVDMGVAFDDHWVRKYGQHGLSNEGREKPLPPLPPSSTARKTYPKRAKLSRENSGSDPLLDARDDFERSRDYDVSSDTMVTDEWGRLSSSPVEASSSSTFHARSPSAASSLTKQLCGNDAPRPPVADITRVLAIIEGMKQEPEWRAVRYQLLTRNCNNFTNDLCQRLTGRDAPSWINRAAWLGQSLPCLVPDGWLEPPAAEDHIDSSPQGDRSQHTWATQQDHEYDGEPLSPLIAVPYVETRPTKLDVHYANVREP